MQSHYGKDLLLFRAATDGRVDLVDMILKHIQVRLSKEPALRAAARRNHLEIVDRLLQEKGIDINRSNRKGVTPLINACARGHLRIVNRLLADKNIDVNATHPKRNTRTALSHAALNGHVEIVGRLLQERNVDVNKDEPLASAVERGHHDVVRRLLEEPDIDVNLAGPLACAVFGGYTKIVQCLLEVPAVDPNYIFDRNAPWGGRTAFVTAFVTAAVAGRTRRALAEILLSDERMDMEFQFRHAVTHNSKRAVKMILNNASSVNVNGVDAHGDTVLHVAAKNMGRDKQVRLIFYNRKCDRSSRSECYCISVELPFCEVRV